MIHTRAATLALGVLALALLSLAGCGGGGGSSSDADEQAQSEPYARAANVTGSAIVRVTTTPTLGRVLADADGTTLYVSHGDEPMIYEFNRDPIPSCYDACAETWPPLLTVDPPTAIGSARESMLSTIARGDGGRQVTYDGHPLYTYTKDIEPGETHGDDAVSFGQEWHALDPSGEESGN